eukprot:c7542_g1_i1.p1 GENE.c7542_g1_i1~~c7542_g1_i1.p1  ORF type:complete len:188 (+),score=51.80 c7542_g1_i1:77-640(+)
MLSRVTAFGIKSVLNSVPSLRGAISCQAAVHCCRLSSSSSHATKTKISQTRFEPPVREDVREQYLSEMDLEVGMTSSTFMDRGIGVYTPLESEIGIGDSNSFELNDLGEEFPVDPTTSVEVSHDFDHVNKQDLGVDLDMEMEVEMASGLEQDTCDHDRFLDTDLVGTIPPPPATPNTQASPPSLVLG